MEQSTATPPSSSVVKRNRSTLSCTNCRNSKSKCDREQPCSLCMKKGRSETCSYPLPANRKRPPASLQKRLRHLESMVKDIMTTEENTDISTGASSLRADSSRSLSRSVDGPPYHGQPYQKERDSIGTSGNASVSHDQVILEAGQSKYIGSTHWAAFLEDIEEVRTYLQDVDDEERGTTEDISAVTTFAFNVTSSATKSDLIDRLPERSVVDRLASRYFTSHSPSLCIIHAPTFQIEYQRFWDHPESAPASWLGLLYAIMILSSLSTVAMQENHPDQRSVVGDIIQLYRSCCTQCLVLSNFTKPGPYTIETLIIHSEGEFIWNKANHTHYYLLVGSAVRLALIMGLHRDPSKIQSNITVFQAEMRRRVWTMLCQGELLASFHVGLPGLSPSVDSDTLPPRNLHDAEFGEHSTELPESRPDSDLTPVSHAILKGRLCKIAGKISQLVNSSSSTTLVYANVLDLDHELVNTYSKFPAQFIHKSSGISITDAPEMIVKRLSMALTFQKARSILHRKFFTRPHENGAYDYSKSMAVDASLETLRIQSLLHEAFSPGGPLSGDRWFLSALSMQDFLVAAMIVYSTVMGSLQKIRPVNGLQISSAQRGEMIALLKKSHIIWSQTDNKSADMEKASRLIGALLDKLQSNLAHNPDFNPNTQTRQGSAMTTESYKSGSIFEPYPNTASSIGTARTDNSWLNEGNNLTTVQLDAQQGLSLDFSNDLQEIQNFGANSIDWSIFEENFQQGSQDNYDWSIIDPQFSNEGFI